jgi:hypothetical protein
MPKMRPKVKGATTRAPLTLGDLISAACDTLGDTRAVARLLGSNAMREQIGRKLVFL